MAPGLTGDTVVVGATIAAYPATDPLGSGSAVASTTTGSDGTYSLAVPTGGVALDGFVLATDGSDYIPTYLWPPAPLAADYAGANIKLLSTSNEGLATGSLCGVSGGQSTTDALIGLEVVTSAGSDVAGATVISTPAAGKDCYDGSNGLPSTTATSTGSDGVALVINVPPGNVTLSGSATGDSFASLTVCGVAGAFTTTLVVEQ